jgi:hypothetical protein
MYQRDQSGSARGNEGGVEIAEERGWEDENHGMYGCDGDASGWE